MRVSYQLVFGLLLAVPAPGQTTAPAAAPPILQGATLPVYLECPA
jgi:hypothetical protein